MDLMVACQHQWLDTDPDKKTASWFAFALLGIVFLTSYQCN